MDYFAGLDVSVKETGVCIVDDAGKIVREARVASEPEALLQVLTNTLYRIKRVGLEAGPLSQWLYSCLAEAGLPVICVETRHMRAMLKAQINKTDSNDARDIAQMMRVGLYRPVHVKTLRSQKLRVLLTHRKLLQSKAIVIENDLRATLRNFGLRWAWWGRSSSRRVSGSLSRTSPIWPRWWNRCSLSGGSFASNSASCIAACWPSSGTMMCAGA
jgi:transposase